MPCLTASSMSESKEASPGWPMTAMPSGLVATACWNCVIIVAGSQLDHWYDTSGPKAACAAFGPDVSYQWSNWDPATMITQFQQAVATKPDGIAVMGHPGDASFDSLIDDAVKQGIAVTVMNTELPKAESAHALGYTGAVLHDAGASLANEAIKRGNLKSGDEVFVWGLAAQAGRGERTKGITDALKAAGLTVDYYEIDTATNADPNAGTATFTGYVASHPKVKAIFIDHGNLTSAIPTFMKAANLAAGSVFA